MPPKPPEPDPLAVALEGRPESLHEVPAGRRVRIVSLPSHPHLRERLKALGIRPGVVVQVVRRGRPGGILHLAHGPLEFMLRREHAAEIQVLADQGSGQG
jgi:ferrous iron transport protein A